MKQMFMYFFMIVCLLIIFSCAGLKRVRTIQDDNIFYSSSQPKIKIKINPDFKYVEEKDESHMAMGFDSRGSDKTSNVKADNYSFYDTLSEKIVLIQIKELITTGWEFSPILFEEKNTFESGTVEIHRVRYQYSVYAVSQPLGYFLIKALGRRLGFNNNVLIGISYIEKVTGDWSDINQLNSEQNKQLLEFIDDSKKDIQILE